jgi:hypothetical protein
VKGTVCENPEERFDDENDLEEEEKGPFYDWRESGVRYRNETDQQESEKEEVEKVKQE